jgi:A/G-specific adenine glycosylase
MTDFPTLQALASADEEQVLMHWQGLGYYSRARNISKPQKFSWKIDGAAFPDSRREIEALPGIGR